MKLTREERDKCDNEKWNKTKRTSAKVQLSVTIMARKINGKRNRINLFFKLNLLADAFYLIPTTQ